MIYRMVMFTVDENSVTEIVAEVSEPKDVIKKWWEDNIELEEGEHPRSIVAKEAWKACRKEVFKILKSSKYT